MSGFVGIHRRDGSPVDPTVLERMLRATAHRGSDGHGRWVRGSIGLGHRIRFITPESLRERQPLTSRDGRLALVWDGRLDNREELISALDHAQIELGEKTDPDLAMGAYRLWGLESPQRLLGDFAYAVWDDQEQSLFCARDRLGLKPFHYTCGDHLFLFGSEITPLCAALGSTPEPDDEMVLAFLLKEFRERDQARTFYEGIRRLPPGHYLLSRNGHLCIQRYWSIDPSRETRYQRTEEYADHFRTLFQEAVRCRLRSYFPIGISLSGGLDSSAILCTAEKLSATNGDTWPTIEAFTLYSDDPDTDERDYFTEVIRATGVKSRIVRVTYDADPLPGLEMAIGQADTPIIGPGFQEGRELREAIESRGCRVLLSGEGGDELLGETGHLADLLRRLRLWRFYQETRTMARWYGADPWEFARMAGSSLLPPLAKYWGKRLLRGVPPPWMNADTARAVRLRERIREPQYPKRFPSLIQEDTYLSVLGPYFILKLEVDERYLASFGMEARYPFLDSRLVEFILSIPGPRRTSNGIWKAILREAMRGVLPEPIRMRTSKGDWNRQHDRVMKTLCRRDTPAPLENVSGRMDRYLNFAGVRALLKRYHLGDRDLLLDIWFFITLDRWLARLGERGGHGQD